MKGAGGRGHEGAGVDGELKWAPAICINVDQNERLSRAGQPHRHFRERRRRAGQLEAFWIVEVNFAPAIIERDPEMLEEIVAEIAINLRADRLADVTQIDEAHIHVVHFRGGHRERTHLCERDRNRASRALTFL